MSTFHFKTIFKDKNHSLIHIDKSLNNKLKSNLILQPRSGLGSDDTATNSGRDAMGVRMDTSGLGDEGHVR